MNTPNTPKFDPAVEVDHLIARGTNHCEARRRVETMTRPTAELPQPIADAKKAMEEARAAAAEAESRLQATLDAKDRLEALRRTTDTERKHLARMEGQLSDSKAIVADVDSNFVDWPKWEQSSHLGFMFVVNTIQNAAVHRQLVDMIPAAIKAQQVRVRDAEKAATDFAKEHGFK